MQELATRGYEVELKNWGRATSRSRSLIRDIMISKEGGNNNEGND